MNLQDYILNEIKELRLLNSVKDAQKLFKGLPITHVAIVENGQLLGAISERDIHTIENKNSLLSEFSHLIDLFYVKEDIVLLELIKAFADNDSNVMPVLNDEMIYIGYFELSDILDVFSSSPFMYGEGNEIVIEVISKDYSASEISQIVESNNGKVLGMFVSHETSDATQVTVKVASDEMNELIQTFRRYDYNIISEYKDDHYLQDLKDRSNYLKKYLDM